MREVGAKIRRLREGRGWTGAQLAVYAGMAPSAVSQIETGKRSPNTGSLAKIARALEVELADLFPKAPSGSSLEPSLFNGGREEERPTARWSAAVDGAQRLRETGSTRIRKALSEWSASKQRGEPYAARREYLEEMGNLLQEAYDADGALGWAYIEAALTQGGSEAEVPSYLREESRTMGHFYGELLGLVKSAGLSVRTGVAPASAKRDAKVRSETTPHSVEEPKAA